MAAAPADSTCSHSGIFTCGPARLTTCDHERRAGQPLALVVELIRLGLGIFGAERRLDGLPCSKARLALEYDEAPWRELAMVRHARGDRQKRLDLGR